ncbi:MAG: hypothetical protein AAF456_09175 [Planctomycetota bacterium]
MSIRAVIAGVVAGIVLFVWGFVTNMIIPLGEVGIKYLDRGHEEAVLNTMREQIEEPGLYFMPGWDRSLTGEELNSELARWNGAYESGPTGFLIFHPTGTSPISPRQLGVQLILDLFIGVFAAFIISHCANAGFVSKLTIAGLCGVLAFLASDAAYCNWFRYPLDFTLAKFADKVCGFLLVGLTLAILIKARPDQGKTERSDTAK